MSNFRRDFSSSDCVFVVCLFLFCSVKSVELTRISDALPSSEQQDFSEEDEDEDDDEDEWAWSSAADLAKRYNQAAGGFQVRQEVSRGGRTNSLPGVKGDQLMMYVLNA